MIPLNPFEGSEEFTDKSPEDMSVDELKMYLHIKRLNLKLDVERFKGNINYTKMLIDTATEMGLVEKLEKWVYSFMNMPTIEPESNPQNQPSNSE